MKETSNYGIGGVESIRLGGMVSEDLPLAEAAQAREGITKARETERQNKINDILITSPKQKIDYLESRIVECRVNIGMQNQSISDIQTKISEYSSQITLCEFRDKEIERIEIDDPKRKEIIKDLKKRFPLYNVQAMKDQIGQFKLSNELAMKCIIQENDSIAELTGVIAECKKRDTDLKKLGTNINKILQKEDNILGE